jgi:hypothetical protein
MFLPLLPYWMSRLSRRHPKFPTCQSLPKSLKYRLCRKFLRYYWCQMFQTFPQDHWFRLYRRGRLFQKCLLILTYHWFRHLRWFHWFRSHRKCLKYQYFQRFQMFRLRLMYPKSHLSPIHLCRTYLECRKFPTFHLNSMFLTFLLHQMYQMFPKYQLILFLQTFLKCHWCRLNPFHQRFLMYLKSRLPLCHLMCHSYHLCLMPYLKFHLYRKSRLSQRFQRFPQFRTIPPTQQWD